MSSAKIYAESRSGQPCSSSSYESTNKQCDNLYQNSFIHKLTHFKKKKKKSEVLSCSQMEVDSHRFSRYYR